MEGGQEPPKGCTCDPSLAVRRIHKMSCPAFTKPLSPEELEKQIRDVLTHPTRPEHSLDDNGQPMYFKEDGEIAIEEDVKRLLALFAQHTQAAVPAKLPEEINMVAAHTPKHLSYDRLKEIWRSEGYAKGWNDCVDEQLEQRKEQPHAN